MSAAGTTLIQLTDTHLLDDGALLRGSIDTWARTTEVLRAAARFAPDAVLVTGDIADRGAQVYSRAAALFEQTEHELGCPLVVVPGNHDPHCAVGAGFNLKRLASGPGPADTVQMVGGLRIIGLETHGFGEAAGYLSAGQLEWLRSVLEIQAPAGTVLAMHHPPIESLMESLAGRGLARPQELAAVLQGTDVRGILCGHYHLACSGTLGSIPVWVSPAVSYNHELFAPGTAGQRQDTSWFSVITLSPGQLTATPVQVAIPVPLLTVAEAVPARHHVLI